MNANLSVTEQSDAGMRVDRRTGLKCACCVKAVMCCLTTSVVVAITAVSTFYFAKYALSGKDVAMPKVFCNNSLAFWETYYGSESVVMGQAKFEYAFLFAPTWSSENGGMLSGNLFICYQTLGMQASGPGNCSNSFTYNRHTCALSVEFSECQKQVAHQHTDVEIQWIEYDSEHDRILMDGKTHMPGWTNPAKYLRTANPIQCPSATRFQPLAQLQVAGCRTKLAYWETYFASIKVVGGLAHFEYSFLFALESVSAGVASGNAFICFQTLGMQASGPGNCSNTFTFNENTCELNVGISECQKQVAVQHTDLHIQSLSYDSTIDAINLVGETHMPGWTNPAVFPRAANVIQCPPATLAVDTRALHVSI